mmetsp:Transcript_4655/g.11404  ORF Transcript_4655/g.11404 Transcript_4655/m.11404 type:complete len:230 (-) Transcript_4655:2646-3335(-)
MWMHDSSADLLSKSRNAEITVGASDVFSPLLPVVAPSPPAPPRVEVVMPAAPRLLVGDETEPAPKPAVPAVPLAPPPSIAVGALLAVNGVVPPMVVLPLLFTLLGLSPSSLEPPSIFSPHTLSRKFHITSAGCFSSVCSSKIRLSSRSSITERMDSAFSVTLCFRPEQNGWMQRSDSPVSSTVSTSSVFVRPSSCSKTDHPRGDSTFSLKSSVWSCVTIEMASSGITIG